MKRLLLVACAACQPNVSPVVDAPVGAPVGAEPTQVAAEVTDSECPQDFVAIAAASAVTLGENDAPRLERYGPNDAIEATVLDVSGYCIGRWPAPGVKGADWPVDGLSHSSASSLEKEIARFGLRLCSVTELLYAAAGRENRRFPSEAHVAPDGTRCETDDQSPRPLGSYPECASGFGVEDFGVRSAWARLDTPMEKALSKQREALTPDAGGLAIWGGTTRTDTYYAPNNYGIHFHGEEESAYGDDSVRFCADLGGVSAEEQQALSAWLGVFSATPSFAAMLSN